MGHKGHGESLYFQFCCDHKTALKKQLKKTKKPQTKLDLKHNESNSILSLYSSLWFSLHSMFPQMPLTVTKILYQRTHSDLLCRDEDIDRARSHDVLLNSKPSWGQARLSSWSAGTTFSAQQHLPD